MRKNAKIDRTWSTKDAVVNLTNAGGKPGQIASRLGRPVATINNILWHARNEGLVERKKRANGKTKKNGHAQVAGGRVVKRQPKNFNPSVLVIISGKDVEKLLSQFSA